MEANPPNFLVPLLLATTAFFAVLSAYLLFLLRSRGDKKRKDAEYSLLLEQATDAIFLFTKDGRVVMVRITEEGRRAQSDVAARRAHVMARVLSAFPPEERAALADLLDRFVRSVDDVVESLDERPAGD